MGLTNQTLIDWIYFVPACPLSHSLPLDGLVSRLSNQNFLTRISEYVYHLLTWFFRFASNLYSKRWIWALSLISSLGCLTNKKHFSLQKKRKKQTLLPQNLAALKHRAKDPPTSVRNTINLPLLYPLAMPKVCMVLLFSLLTLLLHLLLCSSAWHWSTVPDHVFW